jgi:hypothetical protein
MYPYGLLLALLFLAGAWIEPRQQAPTSTPGLQVPIAQQSSAPAPAVTRLAPASPAILAPQPGQALQGVVPIVVDTTMDGFQSAELSFAYTDDPAGTWFLLHETNQPTSASALMQWDTGAISDGTYTLRLVVTLMDGSQKISLVPGLRVRNYTPIETDTPTPIAPTSTPQPSPPADTPRPTTTNTPTMTPLPPTRTPLPSNPASLSRGAVWVNLGKGALAVLGFFALIGLYQSIRSFGRKG